MSGPLHRLLSALRGPEPEHPPAVAGPAGLRPHAPASAAASAVRLAARAEALSGALPPLLTDALRLAETVAAGLHGRHRTGTGEDFWQFRPYDRGDPVSLIDWRQSARRQHAYIRQREWTVAQTITLWCGGHEGMRWRSAAALPEKIDHARLLTLALAALLLRGGERVHLLTEDGDLPPADTGRAALHTMASRLCHPAAGGDLPPGRDLPRHGRAVLISDFLTPPDRLEPVLRRMAAADIRGHLIQILDPAEETFPFEGRIRFRAPGPAAAQDWVVPRCEDLRDDYRHRLSLHRDALAALCRSTGWQLSAHRTDHPLPATLLGLYQALSGGSGREGTA